MATENAILELKFEGGGINPASVRAAEVAELILSFEKAVISTLHDKYPNIDTTQYAFLSFSSIENKSLGLKFLAERATDAFINSYLFVTTSISNDNYTELSAPTLDSLKSISRFTKRHNCECNYIYEGTTIAKFTPLTNVEISDDYILKGETVIHGKIQRVGGDTPRVVFKEHTGKNIYFEVTEEIAKQLAPKLYEDVALHGVAKWDKKTYRVIDFKVSSIGELKDISLTDAFKQIQDIIGKYWDEVDDIQAVIN
jgi:hypothetical protein